MAKVTADQAKRNFGALLRAAADEPVEITRHGRPACYIISSGKYEELYDAWLEFRRNRVLELIERALAAEVEGDDGETDKLVRIANNFMANDPAFSRRKR